MDKQLYDALVGLSPWLATVVAFLAPWVRDKVWPAYVEERRAQRDAAHAREDRVSQALTNNTQALTALQGTLQGVNTQLAQQAETLVRLEADVAGLYGSLNRPRPSRTPGGKNGAEGHL